MYEVEIEKEKRNEQVNEFVQETLFVSRGDNVQK